MHLALRLLPIAAVLLAAPAYAVEPTLSLGGHLAASTRYLSDTTNEPNEDQFEAVNNGSYLSLTAALKGEAYRMFLTGERGVKNDKLGIEATRQVFGGLQTPIGSLTAGRMIGEYRAMGELIDPFYDTAVVGFNGRAFGEGASYGFSNLNNGISRNHVSLKSAAIGDLVRVNVGGYFSDRDEPNDQIDVTTGVSLTQKLSEDGAQVHGAVQYLRIKNPVAWAQGNPRNNEQLQVAGSPGRSINIHATAAVTMPTYSLGVNYENVDVATEARARHYWAVTATRKLSDTTRFAASFGLLDFPGRPAIEGKGYSLGLFNKMSDNTTVYVAARTVNQEVGDDIYTLAAGFAFNFSTTLIPFGAGGGGE